MDTLDVRDIPDEKVRYLEQLIELWKGQSKAHQQEGDDVNPSDFIVRDSQIQGGLIRAMAYED